MTSFEQTRLARSIEQTMTAPTARSLSLGRRVRDAITQIGFGAITLLSCGLLLALIAMGLDQVTAFTALAASISNLGPGLGAVAAHFGGLSAPAKWLLSFAMVMGRLEIFTLLVLFTPAFWRR